MGEITLGTGELLLTQGGSLAPDREGQTSWGSEERHCSIEGVRSHG